MPGFIPLQPYPYKNNTNTSSAAAAVVTNLTVTTLHVLGTSQFDGAVLMSSNLDVSGTLTVGTLIISSLTVTTLTATGHVSFTANTSSSSKTTGTLVITGGLGVSQNINALHIGSDTISINPTANNLTGPVLDLFSGANSNVWINFEDNNSNDQWRTGLVSGVYEITYNGTTVMSNTLGGPMSFPTGVSLTNIKANNLILIPTSTVTSTTPVVLTVNSTQFQTFTGSTNQSLVFPDARTLSLGQTYTINNSSTALITILDASSATIYTNVPSQIATISLVTNSTLAGTWYATYNSIYNNVIINQSSIGTGTTTLTNQSNEIQVMSGSGNPTINLPNATTLVASQSYFLNNNATGTLTLKDGSGATIGTYFTGAHITVYCTSTSTSAGVWDIVPNLPKTINIGTSIAQWNGTFNLGRIIGNYLNTFGETGSNAMINLNSSISSPACNILYIDPINANQWRMGNNGSIATFELIFNDTTSAFRAAGTTGLVTFPNGIFATQATIGGQTLLTESSGCALNIVSGDNASVSQIGSFFTSGGIHVTKDIYCAGKVSSATLTTTGQVNFTAGISSTSTTTGTLVITGGVGITGDTYIGGTLYATLATNPTLAVSPVVQVTLNSSTALHHSNALIVINDNYHINYWAMGTLADGDFNLAHNTTSFLIQPIGNTATSFPLGITTPSTTTTTLTASGATTLTANTASTSYTSGTLVITGGAGISGNVNFNTGGISNDATYFTNFSGLNAYTPTVSYQFGTGNPPTVTLVSNSSSYIRNGLTITYSIYCTWTYITTAPTIGTDFILLITHPSKLVPNTAGFCTAPTSNQTTIETVTKIYYYEIDGAGNLGLVLNPDGTNVTNAYNLGASGGGSMYCTITY